MLKRFLMISAAIMALAGASHAEQTPAGYVMSIELHGQDETAKTVILREGQELAAKLMMPLYAKDVIFLRDGESKITVEMGSGTEKEITGAGTRFEVSGEVETGDDAWSLISAVANVIGGSEGEALPDNMASRGDENELKIPMAVHGPNFLPKDTKTLWLAWSGGKGPYKVIVDVEGRAKVYDKIREQEFTFDAPQDETQRFTVTIKDSAGHVANVVMRYRNGLPTPNEGFKGKLPEGEAGDVVYAAWMTGLHEGDWTIAAAQLLHGKPDSDTAAKTLLAKLLAGWKLGN